MRSLDYLLDSSVYSRDYRRLAKIEYEKLKGLPVMVNDDLLDSLLLQSLLGRIRSGHGFFRRSPLPDLGFDRVCDLLDFSSFDIRQKRQTQIDLFRNFIEGLVEKDENDLKKNKIRGYGTSFLKRYKIRDLKQALKGAVLMGFHDSAYWRKKTENYYSTTLNGRNFRMGYGYEYLIDEDALKEEGISISNLESLEYNTDDIEALRSKGVIVNNQRGSNVTNQFIRFKCGYGTCDDASLLSIGKIHGFDAMLLGFLVDATDTYEKACLNPIEGGFDESIANYIQSEWKKKYGQELVSSEEIMQIIYLGAKSNSSPLPFSSSHRRFCQRERRINSYDYSSEPTIINHLRFLKSEGTFLCKLGHSGFNSNKFYEIMKERWKKYNTKYGLSSAV